MSAPIPRYRQLADELRADIAAGRLKPGAQLATEMELCALHSVSRHTAREALRLLAEDGLIERRRGAGTVVADVAAPAFAQPIGDFDTILQYAHKAVFLPTAHEPASEELLERFGLTGAYDVFTGLRRLASQPPLALTTILVRRDLAPDQETVGRLTGSISEWIEQTHGVAVQRVVQRMEAVALDADAAHELGVSPGTPALRTVRRYRDAGGAIILLSESLHPAGRFAYEMRLDRAR